MKLDLTQLENQVFYSALYFEIKYLEDGYDPNTCRRPRKNQLAKLPYTKAVYDKWIKTQPKLKGGGLVFIDLESLKPCSLELTEGEVGYVKYLMQFHKRRDENSLKGQNPPYTGIFSIIEENIKAQKEILRKCRQTRTPALEG